MNRNFYRIYYSIHTWQVWLNQRFTKVGLILLFILIISAILGGNTNENMIYQIFSLLIAFFLLAITWSFYFPVKLKITRILPRFSTVNMPLKYYILINNQTNKTQIGLQIRELFKEPRPTFLQFKNTPEPLEKKRNKIDQKLGYYRWSWLIKRNEKAKVKTINLPPLPPYRQTRITLEILPTDRGLINLSGFSLLRSDPLNIFNACKIINLPQSLLVLPKLYTLPPIQLLGERKYHSGGVALTSSVGDSEEFQSLREYRPGDPLKKIHWKSWAKIGQPIVREEENEFFVRHALILDTFTEAQYSNILEEAIAVAGSFACEVQTQESLLDLMFVGLEAYCFTFGRALSHTEKMLEILAGVRACHDKTFDDLMPIINQKIDLLSGCILVLIKWDQEREKLIKFLAQINIAVLVLIMTEDELIINQFYSDLIKIKVININRIKEELARI